MTSKHHRLLTLQPPDQLNFSVVVDKATGKRGQAVCTRALTVGNRSGKETMLFKVKTTTPTLYTVKPNMGLLAPHQEMELMVSFYCFGGEIPTAAAASKHKFLVLACSLTQEEVDKVAGGDKPRLDEVWGKVDKMRIEEHRIGSVFKEPAPPAQSITTRPEQGTGQETSRGQGDDEDVARKINEMEEIEPTLIFTVEGAAQNRRSTPAAIKQERRQRLTLKKTLLVFVLCVLVAHLIQTWALPYVMDMWETYNMAQQMEEP